MRLRAERLGEHALEVPVISETAIEAVIATLESERPQACVIDSIQTMRTRGDGRRAGVGRPGPGGRRTR